MRTVVYERNGDVGELLLTAPPLNLVGREMLDELFAALDAAVDDHPRAVLVRADGDNFSAGADVSIFAGHDLESARRLLHPMVDRLEQFTAWPVPKVAAVNGLCLAAGFELALACDVIWAADTSAMGLVEAVVGVTPFGGGTARLAARCGIGRAAEAVYSGRVYDAETMAQWGVVQRVVPADQLLDKSRRLAAGFAAGPTRAHAATSAVLRAFAANGGAAADEALREHGPQVLLTDDVQHGVASLLESGPGHASFVGH